MKYTDVLKCCKIAEDSVAYSESTLADADVRLVMYQDGANGPLKQKVCFTMHFDDADVTIEVTPKEGASE